MDRTIGSWEQMPVEHRGSWINSEMYVIWMRRTAIDPAGMIWPIIIEILSQNLMFLSLTSSLEGRMLSKALLRSKKTRNVTKFLSISILRSSVSFISTVYVLLNLQNQSAVSQGENFLPESPPFEHELIFSRTFDRKQSNA